MKKILKISPSKILLFLALACSVFARQSWANGRNLTIFAEPNIAISIGKIARNFSQKNNVTISINSSYSQDLVSVIDSGDPADIMISADNDFIENLRQKGLVDVYNVGYIAKDTVALITSKNNPQQDFLRANSIEESLNKLNQNKGSLVIDYFGTSLGKIAKSFVEKGDFLAIKVTERIYEDKSFSILKLLKNDDQLCGIVFKSQIGNEKNLVVLSENRSKKTFYQALAIAGDNMELAREFLKFLKSPSAKKILKNGGFAE